MQGINSTSIAGAFKSPAKMGPGQSLPSLGVDLTQPKKALSPAPTPEQSKIVPNGPAPVSNQQRIDREQAYRQTSASALSNRTPNSFDANQSKAQTQKLQLMAQEYEKMGDHASAKMIRSQLSEMRRGEIDRIKQGVQTTAPTPSAQDQQMINGLRRSDEAKPAIKNEFDQVYQEMGLSPSQSQATQFLQKKYGREVSPEEAQIIKQSTDEQLYQLLTDEGAFK